MKETLKGVIAVILGAESIIVVIHYHNSKFCPEHYLLGSLLVTPKELFEVDVSLFSEL